MTDAVEICPFCGKAHRFESVWYEKRVKENACKRAATEYMVEHCDSNTCIRTKAGLPRGENWHEWPCTECAINPYNNPPYQQKIRQKGGRKQ